MIGSKQLIKKMRHKQTFVLFCWCSPHFSNMCLVSIQSDSNMCLVSIQSEPKCEREKMIDARKQSKIKITLFFCAWTMPSFGNPQKCALSPQQSQSDLQCEKNKNMTQSTSFFCVFVHAAHPVLRDSPKCVPQCTRNKYMIQSSLGKKGIHQN